LSCHFEALVVELVETQQEICLLDHSLLDKVKKRTARKVREENLFLAF
jgi:hypothetical protein